MRLRDAALVPAVHVTGALADAAVELVGAVLAVHVPVAPPVVGDAALHVALEPRWTNCTEYFLIFIREFSVDYGSFVDMYVTMEINFG